MSTWLPVGYTEPYNDQQEFDTHFNYISALNVLTDNISLKTNQKFNTKKLPDLDKKTNLIKLTLKSLKDEYDIVQKDAEYSYASMSWLPVKSYYLLYNTLLTIEYVVKCNSHIYELRHQKCIEEFTRKIETKEIEFDIFFLNQVFDKDIFNLKFAPGLNLSMRTTIDILFSMLMKKASIYKLESWQRNEKIKDFKTKKCRAKKEAYLDKFKISIFEFPYYMRVRCNYKDLSFIDRVSSQDTAKYFNAYYNFTLNMLKALNGLKEEILTIRGYLL